jgi:hypothetical protein
MALSVKAARSEKSILVQVHSNYLEFVGYVRAVVKRLRQNFQPRTMTFDRDIHEIRVKNRSFSILEFSIHAHPIYLFFLV